MLWGAAGPAAAGVGVGWRAATLARRTGELGVYCPKVTVWPGPIYVRDGEMSTSPGFTAGIDLALAFVEEDAGHEVAMAVARQLVVFLNRPVRQAPFSPAMQTPAPAPAALSQRQACTREHLADHLPGLA